MSCRKMIQTAVGAEYIELFFQIVYQLVWHTRAKESFLTKRLKNICKLNYETAVCNPPLSI